MEIDLPMSRPTNMVWTRDQRESSCQKRPDQRPGGQSSSGDFSAQPKKMELKQSLKKKIDEFQKLMKEESEQEEMIKDSSPP